MNGVLFECQPYYMKNQFTIGIVNIYCRKIYFILTIVFIKIRQIKLDFSTQKETEINEITSIHIYYT